MGFDARGERRSRSGVQPHDRRTFLQALYGATLGAVLAACGSNDADVFAAGDGTSSDIPAGTEVSTAGDDSVTPQTLRVQVDGADPSSTTTGTSDSATATGSSTSTTGDTAATTSTTAETETTATSTTGTSSTATGGTAAGALPTGGTMVVAFTYERQPAGKNVPPYIAVWIEDGSGNLLTTVALWYQQFGRGERWLPDLARWYTGDQNRLASGGADTVDAISGPTRPPGSYQVAWDGRANGSPAPAGSYFVCIESARERGPYSLIRQSVNLRGSTQQQSLSSDGELVNASITVVA